MVFKTRVGLCVLNKNIEIRTFLSPDSRTWSICAQRRSGPEIESKSVLGKSTRFGGTWFTLAVFQNKKDIDVEIGEAMQTIACAYDVSASICDLSSIGSAQAWRENSENWAIIRWP